MEGAYMKYEHDDGGRGAAGYKGSAGDCVCRAIAIAGQIPYEYVYETLANGMGSQRKSRGRTARNGISVRRKWFKDYMSTFGFIWHATMQIGSGCKVHLHDGELPMGRLVVSLSKHYTAVIDGVIHDTHDPQREIHIFEQDSGRKLKSGEQRNHNGIWHVARRCVYGYWEVGA
jgi:hypothetical protein